MRLLLTLSLLLTASISFGQQGLVGQYIKLLPTTIPTTCRPGDIRFQTGSDVLNVCTNSNTWVGNGVTQTGTSGTYYPGFFSSSTTGGQNEYLSTGFSINPSTDVVTATTFNGALTGNATSATNATNGATVSVSNSASYFPLFAASSTNSNQPFNLGSGLTFNPSTNNLSTTTFTGVLSGNATTATTATNATNVGTNQTAANSTYYPLLGSTSANGNQAPWLSTGFSVNPSTDIVTATTFSGALSGNASTATTATNGSTVSVSNSASYFPLFAAASANSNQPFNLGTGLTFNPSTNNLSTTTFTGALSGNASTATSATSSTNATNVATTSVSSNALYYPLIVSSSSNGNQAANLMTGFTFNPSTDILYATTFNGALAGNATTATTATNSTNGNTTQVSNNALYYPLMVSSTTNGFQAHDLMTGFTFNPSTDVLMATTFNGALSGNATTSTTATNATNMATVSTVSNANFYPILAAATANSNQPHNLMTGFQFNPGLDTLSAGSFITGYSTGVTAGGTFTLTNASPGQDIMTGSTTQTIKLPVTSTLNLGQSFFIVNNSSGNVTVQSSGANSIQVMAGSTFATFTCVLTSGTTAASWSVEYTPPAGTPTFSGLTQWGAMYASNTTTAATTAAGAGGDVLTWLTNSSAPLPQYPSTGNYYSGYMGNGSSWAENSATLASGTNTGGNTLTAYGSPTMTVTAGASNKAAIVITPASTTAVYLVIAVTGISTDGVNPLTIGMTNGTVMAEIAANSALRTATTIQGILAAGSTNAQTVELQIAEGGAGAGTIGASGSLAHSIEWTVIRIF